MKKTFAFLFILAAASLSQINSAFAICEAQIDSIVADSGNRSDYPASPVLNGTLFAGQVYKGAQGQVGPFSEDTYLYINSGSHHSGWFQEAFALDMDCRLKKYVLLYAE
ncbi:hypothetical protein [Bdellovibrio svalbardensis]|uniref:Uncharacterized protein n=1 Tax=Bdellovibrio svalbardensis TaxID=2972972 RepID=A0ABT6DJI8_9BACT|nr:hypothetical protein [Bdellovibrio svalbardensis]MDG0817034.1 hypothetical protein [Bdellovibrio svalbardensis]